jgi:hypothetical protein
LCTDKKAIKRIEKMKRGIAIGALLIALMAVPAFGIGIGAAFNAGFLDLPSQAMLSFKLDESPAVFAVGASIGSNKFELGVTADWWMYQTELVSIFHMYVGPGVYAQIGNGFALGVRVPIGVQAFVLEPLELFLEVAPALGIKLSDPIDFPTFGVQGAFGFRFWF